MQQPWIITAALTTTLTVTADTGGLAGLTLGAQSGPPLTVEVNHTDAWGDPGWWEVTAPFVLVPGDQVRLTRASTDPEASILAVLEPQALLTDLTVPGPGQFAVRLDPDETRYLTLPIPDGANGLHVRTLGGRGDIDLRLRNGSGATQPKYTGTVTGNSEGAFVFEAPAGNYEVRLTEGKGRVASTWLIVSYDPAGPLPADSTLTTTDAAQALTLPEGTAMVRYGLTAGSVQVSGNGGTTWTTYDAPFTYTATPEQAARLRFKSAGAPATVTYLPYVPQT